MHWQTPSSKLPAELGWDTLDRRRNYSKVLFICKITKELVPCHIASLPVLSLRESNYNTRSSVGSSTFEKPRGKTNAYLNSFFPSAINGWLALPNNIQNSETLGKFKMDLKVLLEFNIMNHQTSYYLLLHQGKLGKMLTQMRLKLSPLNSHLFSYNLSITTNCPHCLDNSEDPTHYFAICAHYKSLRGNLQRQVYVILTHLKNPNSGVKLITQSPPMYDFLDNYIANAALFTSLLLEGFSTIVELNLPVKNPIINTLHRQLYAVVIDYIYKTKRFIK